MRLSAAVIAILLLAGCSRDEAAGPMRRGSVSTATQSNQRPGFEDPRGLCHALVEVGVPTRGWHGDEIDWFCASNYIDIGAADGAPMATNLAYYVTGEGADRAYEAKLVLNVNNPRTKKQGLKRLAEVIQALSETTRFEVPPSFPADVAAGREVSQTSDHVRYSLTREENRIETYRAMISDADLLQAKEGARSAAAHRLPSVTLLDEGRAASHDSRPRCRV